jgi:hypothetical protein
MTPSNPAAVQDAVDRALDLAEEIETHAAAVDPDALDQAKAAVHAWVDEATSVVVNAALGRVTLVHPDGRSSSITSADLPFRLSR